MQKIGVWRLVPDGNDNKKAEAITSIDETDTEQLLEDVLTASPDLLLPDLILVGRQTETQGGPLDLLGVDKDGRLVVFELKRGKLTRDAVAQAIDYASYLADLESEELCRHISDNSGRYGIEKIEDFGQWYESQYPEKTVEEIGDPRIVLVGLGVDERAKRMVEFLEKRELDISLITFYGFSLGADTLLARQVEVQARTQSDKVRTTKAGNQMKLDELLTALGIKDNYEALTSAAKKGLGDFPYYQWPNPNGYSFYLREATGQSGLTYLTLNAPENKNGKIQIVLQPRAVTAIGEENVKNLAAAMESTLVSKPNGSGEILIDGRKSPSAYTPSLTAFGQRIAAALKTKWENQGESVQ